MNFLRINTNSKGEFTTLDDSDVIGGMERMIGGMPDTRPIMGTDYVCMINATCADGKHKIKVPGYVQEYTLPILVGKIKGCEIVGIGYADISKIMQILAKEKTD